MSDESEDKKEKPLDPFDPEVIADRTFLIATVASIPMASSVESLNAGVAASIALFSVAQARRA